MLKILLPFIASVLFLTGCKAVPTIMSNIDVYNNSNELMSTIESEQDISAIQDEIVNCTKTYVKILPFFDRYVEIDLNGEKQQWFISSLGYIKRKDNNSAQLYKVKNPSVFAEYLK